MSQSEHPDERRARRLAEAKAMRGTPEREAQVAEMLARQAVEEAASAPAPRAARSPSSTGGSAKPRSSAPRVKASAPPPGVFGHPVAEWASMVDAALVVIGAAAAEQRLLTPGDLWTELGALVDADVGDDRFKMPRLLADAAASAAEQGRLLPTAIVVPSEQAGPGRAFFTVAKDLDLLPGDLVIPISDGSWSMPAELREFWRDQVDATFEHYADVASA